MKTILLTFFVFVNFQILFCSITPNILWEKVIDEPDNSNELSEFFVKKIDNEYIYWCEFIKRKENESFDNRNFNFLVTDTLGNLILKKNHIHFDTLAMGNLNIKKKNDNYIFTGPSYKWYGYGDKYQMRQFILNNDGEILKSDIDTSGNYLSEYYAFFIYNNDSIYICNSNEGVRIFNQNAKFIRNQEFDTSGINYQIINRPPIINVKNDGSYLTCMQGPSYSVPDSEMYIIFNKIGSNGKINWTKRYFIGTHRLHQPWQIFEKDDGYLLYIRLINKNVYYSYFLRIDFDGNIIWSNIINEAAGLKIKQLPFSKKYVLFGNTNGTVDGKTISLYKVVVLDSNTNILYDYLWYSNDYKNIVADINEMENGNLLVFGYHDYNDIMLCEIQNPIISVDNLINDYSIKFYPNPATDYIIVDFNDLDNEKVKYKIIDMSGCTVKECETTNGSNIAIEYLQVGIYIIEVLYYDDASKITKYERKKFIKL